MRRVSYMQNFLIIGRTITTSPAIAIAASRAGGLGLLDLTGADLATAQSALAELARYAGEYGVVLSAEIAPTLLNELPDCVSTVVFSAANYRKTWLKKAQRSQRWAWVELYDQAEADQAAKWGADGLLLRNRARLTNIRAACDLPIYVQGAIERSDIAELRNEGAFGIILRDELALTREAQLPLNIQNKIIAGNIDPLITQFGAGVKLAADYASQARTVGGVLRNLRAATPEPMVIAKPAEIAIIGIECVLPGAKNKQQFWENILDSVYAIQEVPADRWDSDLYFDPDRKAKDKLYSKWGGFIDDVPFDPLEFGMPPNSLKAIDPMQLLALKVAKGALQDAGYAGRDVNQRNTGVILGCSGGLGDVGQYYLLRTMLPSVIGEDAAAYQQNTHLPEWTEDSFAGLLPNVTAGRIANRLDFGAVNYVVDAACGSSLAAVHLATKELNSGNADMMVVGGVDTVQSPFGFMCFSATGALTPTGHPRPFDADSDGIAISEGVVMLVLKRLADAERDGDRVYAVLQGVSGSSDGRALGMTAPRLEGQQLALQRVYEQSGIDPISVDLFEAHGTGTAVGDRTEAKSLNEFLAERGAAANRQAIGSVKSMIGHTKAAAGVAGLAKIALALHHKTLPPTLGVTTPNPKAGFGSGPLYVNSETRPWIKRGDLRRAAVSAFGFGGTNFHALLEEYRDDYVKVGARQKWSAELFWFSAETPEKLTLQLKSVLAQLNERVNLADLAYSVWANRTGNVQKVFVANDVSDLKNQLLQALQAGSVAIENSNGKVAFLFSGQGSQYVNMARELAILFDEIRDAFEEADAVLERPISHYVFPSPAFDKTTVQEQQAALTATNIAQPALGTTEIGMLRLLGALGISADVTAGHSYGEYAALHAAGVIDARTLLKLSAERGRCMVEAGGDALGTMAAVSADATTVQAHIKPLKNVWLSNINSPQQTIIAGTDEGVAEAVKTLQAVNLTVKKMNVAAAFHSPVVARAKDAFAEVLQEVDFGQPAVPVYGNSSADVHKPRRIAKVMTDHMVQPVRFVEQIEKMYADGVRTFIEVGPRKILTNLTRSILHGRDYCAVALDGDKQDGLRGLLLALATLIERGVTVDIERLFVGRELTLLDLANIAPADQVARTTWYINGGGVRRQGERYQKITPLTLAAAETVTLGPAPSSNGVQPAGVANRPADNGQSKKPQPQPRAAAPVPAQSSPAKNRPVNPAIMQKYNQLMQTFLHNQRDVMVAALGPVETKAAPPAVTPIQTSAPDSPKRQVMQLADAPLTSATRRLMGDYPVLVAGDLAATAAAVVQGVGGKVGTSGELHGAIYASQAFDAEAAFAVAKRIQLARAVPPFYLLVTVGDVRGGHAARGFALTLAQEWTDITVRHIHFSTVAEMGRALGAEIWAHETAVWFANGVRKTWQIVESPLKDKPQFTLDSSDVIVVTGGARGITASVAERLGKYRPKIIIIGRSALPTQPEPQTTAQLTDPMMIKKQLIATAKSAGKPIVLAEIEQQFKQLMKQRELRDSLAKLAETGATVRYHAADVRDKTAVTAVIEATQREFGKVTGIIHAAGVIEDKRVEAKSAESFSRVYQTKVEGADSLLALIPHAQLKFVAFFSSAASAFGNIGQIDYAAGNGYLNGLAQALCNEVRAVAFCWGAWRGGMVSAELERQFEQRNIPLIEVADGCQAFEHELFCGNDPIVVYADGEWATQTARDHTSAINI